MVRRELARQPLVGRSLLNQHGLTELAERCLPGMSHIFSTLSGDPLLLFFLQHVGFDLHLDILKDIINDVKALPTDLLCLILLSMRL